MVMDMCVVKDHFSKNSILYDMQSGFRPLNSTETCILHLIYRMRKTVDSGTFCGMVMLDLQRAFDTMDYKILLYKTKGNQV